VALYNKWRGQTFDDILGQEHITRTLQNQIRAGRIGHAYLFTGLRGTGKTSTARILAKAINCVGDVDTPPCNRCAICRSLTEGRSLDLVEIDGASNRGVDEIRDLRDRVHFRPSECRYKVYVIDEVHMLTREAFNALLKTLEEPPEHVVFVMCTTEPHRLPDTVLSRCQRFDFRRGTLADIMTKLRTICEREGIAIRDDALEFIARRATGSFRDAESLLDQLSAYSGVEITLEQVQGILGAVPSSLVSQVVRAVVEGNVSAGLLAVNEAYDRGAEPRQFLSDVLEYLRALMLLHVGGAEGLQTLGPETLEDLRALTRHPSFSLGLIVSAIKQFSEAAQSLRYAVRPELPLEMALVESTLAPEDSPGGDAASDEPTSESAAAAPNARGAAVGPPSPRTDFATWTPVRPTGRDSAPQQAVDSRATAPGPTPPPTMPEELPPASDTAEVPSPPLPQQEAQGSEERPLTLDWVIGHWQKVLLQIKSRNAQVQALLNSAEPIEVRGSTIVLGCEAEFHRDKLSQDAKRDLVEQVLGQVLGVPCQVECVVSEHHRRARHDASRAAAGASDLFAAANPRRAAEQRLLDHPAVKALERHGGVVTRVEVTNNEEEDSGQ